ncbi:MAG: succinate dehydrogenase/fumarate reductase iron-sulfur subunit [Chloroflexi bacterium]|nr:MAG: succinate dehydrogenase/fumarate reductase iron-sulfur subunit [Chloroflexota bacterium]
MSSEKWNVTFEVYRQVPGEKPHFDEFKLEVNPDEYVLDGIERIWAFWDRTLCFRHACHHSTCGACGMRVNGIEKLSCITLIRDVTHDGGKMRVEPLRNFPVVRDLAVDMGNFYLQMDAVHHRPVLPVSEASIEKPEETWSPEYDQYTRLSDCIECGLCISACPISGTDPNYLGPAVLAGAQQSGLSRSPQVMGLVDSENGLWRCHSVYECTAVCPSFVDPARRIMDLRKMVLVERVRRLFNRPTRTELRIEETRK